MHTNFPGRFLHWNQIVRCFLCTMSVTVWHFSLSYMQPYLHIHTYIHITRHARMQYCRQSFANLKNSLQIAGNLSQNATYSSWKLHNSTSCLVKRKLTKYVITWDKVEISSYQQNTPKFSVQFFLFSKFTKTLLSPVIRLSDQTQGLSKINFCCCYIDNWNFKVIFWRSLTYSSPSYNKFEFSHHP
jgi:hypothetical protein